MKRKRVKLDYDPEVDAAYLTLAAGKVVESEEVGPGLIVDFRRRPAGLGGGDSPLQPPLSAELPPPSPGSPSAHRRGFAPVVS
jgi:hypothetical protein